MTSALARHTENIPRFRAGSRTFGVVYPRALVRAVQGLHQRVERLSDGVLSFRMRLVSAVNWRLDGQFEWMVAMHWRGYIRVESNVSCQYHLLVTVALSIWASLVRLNL
jgi:hypothetical protein